MPVTDPARPAASSIGRRRWRSTLLASVLAVALGSLVASDAAASSVAYSNLSAGGTATADDFSFANRSRIAQQFTAGASGDITSVTLNLYRDQAWYGPHRFYNVEIWSGNGTTPTASLAVLTTSGDWNTTAIVSGTHGTPPSTVEFTSFTGNTTLVAGTKYWIVVTQAGNGPASKRWIVTGSGNQMASYSAINNTWSNDGTSGNLGAQITVGVVPGSGLAALAVGAAGIRGRRRSRQG